MNFWITHFQHPSGEEFLHLYGLPCTLSRYSQAQLEELSFVGAILAPVEAPKPFERVLYRPQPCLRTDEAIFQVRQVVEYYLEHREFTFSNH